ncbi:MAG TPA: GAF domain-containing protein, partial [Pirellulaceae bacterium]|nr:GAF domain-containing protein [Pirellulaceae bacterium]
MATSPPSYLKLHIEDASAPVLPSQESQWLDPLRQAFSLATGWDLDFRVEDTSRSSGGRGRRKRRGGGGDASAGRSHGQHGRQKAGPLKLGELTQPDFAGPAPRPGSRAGGVSSTSIPAPTGPTKRGKVSAGGATNGATHGAKHATSAAPAAVLTTPAARSSPVGGDGGGYSASSAVTTATLGAFGVPRQRVLPLVDVLNRLCGEVDTARSELRQREAELATTATVCPRRDEGRQLSGQLETLLRTAAEAVGATAAAAYLLDDTTSHLKLRAGWGIPADRFYLPSRSLRGQLADLEALLGRAVAIEDTTLAKSWKPPEECRAALCVPISTATMPLGTMWLFANAPRKYSPVEANIVEIVAGRIAAELDRASLMRELVQTQHVRRQWQGAVQWQKKRLPQVEPLAEGWQVAGWSPMADRLGGEFFDWEVLPSGDLAVSLARAEGPMLDASHAAAMLRGMLRSTLPQSRDPRQLLHRLNDVAWRSSPGEPTGSLVHVRLTPETGDLRLVASGTLGAIMVSDSGPAWIDVGAELLGAGPELDFQLTRRSLGVGDSLVLCGAPLAAPPAPPPSASSGKNA